VGLFVNVVAIILNIDFVGKTVGGMLDIIVGLIENIPQLRRGVVGFLLGILLGTLLGILVGTLVGLVLGLKVGILLGITVGSLDNFIMGFLVIGDTLITFVGLRVLITGFCKEVRLILLEGCRVNVTNHYLEIQ